MSLQDAMVLGQCFAKHPDAPYEALAAYQDLRIEPTSREVSFLVMISASALWKGRQGGSWDVPR